MADNKDYYEDNFDEEEIKQINESLEDYKNGNYKTYKAGNIQELLRDLLWINTQ